MKDVEAKNEERIQDQVQEVPLAAVLTNKEDEILSSPKTKSPWKTGIHEEATKEFTQLPEEMPPLLQSSFRVRHPNQKYANTTLIVENSIEELATY